MAKFVQTIEFKTTRIDEFTSALDDWLATTERGSGATRGLQTKDREQDDTYVQIVEFPSYEQGDGELDPSRDLRVGRNPRQALRRATGLPQPRRPP